MWGIYWGGAYWGKAYWPGGKVVPPTDRMESFFILAPQISSTLTISPSLASILIVEVALGTQDTVNP